MTPNETAILDVLRRRREAEARDRLQDAYAAVTCGPAPTLTAGSPAGGITYYPPYIPQPTTYPDVCTGCGRCRTCGHPAPSIPTPIYPGPYPTSPWTTPGGPSIIIIWCASGTAEPGGTVSNADLTANLNRMPG
jgi:hypothetical protein